MADNALKTLFTNCANAIRETLPDVGKLSPNSFPDKIREVAAAGGGTGGGDTSDLVKWVSFRSGDGNNTLLYKMPVLNGDTCKDPIMHKDILTPLYEDDNNYYMHGGWVDSVGSSDNPNKTILNNITSDKTVYSLDRTIPKSLELIYDSDMDRGCYEYQVPSLRLTDHSYYTIEWDGVEYKNLRCKAYYGKAADGMIAIVQEHTLGNPAIMKTAIGFEITWTTTIPSDVKDIPFCIIGAIEPNDEHTIGSIRCATAGPHTFKITISDTPM